MLGMDFQEAKKILKHKETLPEILAARNVHLVHRQTGRPSISLKNRKEKGLEIDVSGEIIIYIPEGNLTLRMLHDVHLDKNELFAIVKLGSPHENIVDVHTQTHMISQNNDTIVQVTNRLVYQRRIPMFLKNYMDRRVSKAVDEMLLAHEQSLKTVLARHRR